MPAWRRRCAGRPLPRVEARDIVTGRARYVADVRLPGMLRGAIVRPPGRGAKLRALRDAAARKVPGVAAVIRDGDVVGVVAERDDQARAAAGAVEAEWDTVPVEGPTAEVVMRDGAGVDGAIDSATVTLSRTYALPPIANAPIGPSAAVPAVRDGEATIYVGTHRPFGVREQVAKAIGLTVERVRVLPQLTSGSYGRNSHGDAAVEAAILSKGAGRPVLIQWTREEEFAWSPSRPEAVLEGTAWGGESAQGGAKRTGKGIACTVYHGTYVAQVAEVDVAASGAVRLLKAWCVVDPGETINPDGVRNQIEGGIQQSASWALLEELRHRDGRVVTTGWDAYPIATFRDAPESIEVFVEGDERAPATGVGEPGAVPTAAAIANAVYAACGARVRELPLTRERVRQPVAR